MMQKLKSKRALMLIALFLAVILTIFLSYPRQIKAAYVSNSWDWTDYKINYDHCNNIHTDHIVVSYDNDNSAYVDFYGHGIQPYFEALLTDPTDKDTGNIKSEFFNFKITEANTDWHTLKGSGFIFNAKIDPNGSGTSSVVGSNYLSGYNPFAGEIPTYLTDIIESGYFLSYEENKEDTNRSTHKIILYKISNLTIPSTTQTTNDKTKMTAIASIIRPKIAIHNISIQASTNHFTFIDNDEILMDLDIEDTGGVVFGPAVQWNSHCCTSESHIVFSDVQCGVNMTSPVADFDYNMPLAEIRDPVYTIDKSYDTNIPKSKLVEYWTVVKKGENGESDKILCKDSLTPFDQYTENGIGTYITTLKVKNEYNFWAPVEATKSITIVGTPEINIYSEKETYSPGESVVFKTDKWWNCVPTKNSDIAIDTTFSVGLSSPKITIPGSSSITLTDGELECTVTISYVDGTKYTKDITIPAGGLIVTDTTAANSSKEVESINIIYKQLPPSSAIKDESCILYELKTSTDLSRYYNGGTSPRTYSSTATSTFNADGFSINDSVKINYNEPAVSFKMAGTIDNSDAITEPPVCNTEFLLTGKTSGGESINRYIPINNGVGEAITVPFGIYTLSEVSFFETGYETIKPIKLEITAGGIEINGSTHITDGGTVPFVKKILVSKIDVSRIYESFGDIPFNSDVDFKAQLSGTPVISEIEAEFELTSSPENDKYLYDGKNILILPIGTYSITETQAYKRVSLENISVSKNILWSRINSIDPTRTLSPNASFTADRGREISVVLKYVSDGYTYDDVVYNNEIIFSISAVNSGLTQLTEADINKVLVSPDGYKYPITLTNVDTNLEYCGMATSDKPITFTYMYPGKYKVSCFNNMYMDVVELNKINSKNITFTKDNDELYVTIPESSSSISIEEVQSLTDWRGYSNISISSSKIAPEIVTHVSFTALCESQDLKLIPNCSFEISNENGVLYFVEKANKYYPALSTDENVISSFTTNEDGEVHIYKMPVGEYTIKITDCPENIYTSSPSYNVFIDGTRNIGIKFSAANLNTLNAPTSIVLTTAKNNIDSGDSIQIVSKIEPQTAYNLLEYSSSDDNIATVSNTGLVTSKAPGKVTITAKSKKDPSKKATIDLTINDTSVHNLIDIKSSTNSINMFVGDTYSTQTVYTPNNSTNVSLTWSSSSPDVASVSDDGTVTALKEGTTTITMTCGKILSAYKVSVDKLIIPATGITLDNTKLTLVSNNDKLSTGKLVATVLPENSTNKSITYESSDPNIVTVDKDGNITSTGIGVAKVTATTESGISATCIVTSQPIVENIKLNVTRTSLKEGSSFELIPTYTPINVLNPTLEFTSSDTSVATVSENGIVNLVGVGEAEISAIAKYPGTDDVKTTCYVSVVTKIVTATNLDVALDDTFSSTAFNDTIELKQNGQIEFYARIRPASTTEPKIIWTFDKPNIIAIDGADSSYSEVNAVNKYVLAAVGNEGGTVTVTGRVESNPNITTSFVVDVIGDSSDITINKTDADVIVIGKSNNSISAEVKAASTWSRITSVDWDISPEECVNLELSSNGKIAKFIAKSPGTVTAKATAHFKYGNDKTSSFTFKVESPEIMVAFDGNKLINPTNGISFTAGESKILTVEYNFTKDSSGNGFNMSVPTEISTSEAPNPENGHALTLTSDTPGNYTITITPEDTLFSAFNIPVTVYTPITGLTLSSNNESIPVGGTTKLTANVEPSSESGRGVSWSTSDGNIATVDGNGNVHGISAGTATITAEIGSFSASCTVTVVEISSFTISNESASLDVGDTLDLSTTIEPTEASGFTVTWTTSDNTIADVDASGHVTAKAAGTVTITATVGNLTVTCEITVTNP